MRGGEIYSGKLFAMHIKSGPHCVAFWLSHNILISRTVMINAISALYPKKASSFSSPITGLDSSPEYTRRRSGFVSWGKVPPSLLIGTDQKTLFCMKPATCCGGEERKEENLSLSWRWTWPHNCIMHKICHP